MTNYELVIHDQTFDWHIGVIHIKANTPIQACCKASLEFERAKSAIMDNKKFINYDESEFILNLTDENKITFIKTYDHPWEEA